MPVGTTHHLSSPRDGCRSCDPTQGSREGDHPQPHRTGPKARSSVGILEDPVLPLQNEEDFRPGEGGTSRTAS